MSINLNIQVPLETVASMLEVADVDSDRQALAISTAQASKAVLDAVKALPDHVKSELAAKHVKVMVSTFTKRKILITINADAYPADLAYALHINEKVPLDNVSLLFGGLWIFSINGDSVRRTLKEVMGLHNQTKTTYADMYNSWVSLTEPSYFSSPELALWRS